MSNNTKYCKLIMVTGENNNKYYELIYSGVGNSITVNYGRVESTKTTITKSLGDWDKIVREKVNKGYKDVTELHSVAVKKDSTDQQASYTKIEDNKVEEFITLMRKYTNNLVNDTYSVKAVNVSQKQLDEAQKEINEINKLTTSASVDTAKVNSLLLSLYTIIPRKMYNVKSHLIPSIKLENILQQEQDNLDAMASQVAIIKPKTKITKKTKNFLDVLGITMSQAKKYPEIDYLLKQQHGRKVEAIFEVNKPTEDVNYNEWIKDKKNKSSKYLIHGTKCTSVIPILEQGLKIRPTGNFQFSGKAYGNGNYFSEVMQKSLGYTGGSTDKVLLVYEVHTGNPFVYDGWYRGNSFPLDLKNLSERGFDSTYVKAGNGLLNSEIIAYSEKQNHLKFIIWLK